MGRLDNQLSRYGAITKALPHLGPQGKIFFLALSTSAWLGDFLSEFPVDSDGVPRVYTTLASAYAACTASQGDVILALPGYTETITAVQSIAKIGVSLIGVGQGALTPTITINAAADAISLDAASCRIENFRFPAPGTDEATSMINVTAANCVIKNIRGIGSQTSKNFVDCITLASGADDCVIQDVEIYNTVVAVNSFLSIEAAVARLKVLDFFAFGDVVAGGIIDGATATLINFKRVEVHVVGTTKAAATLDSNPTGSIVDSKFSGTSTTLANNAALGTGVRLHNVTVLEETDGSKQGVQIPAVDVD